MVNEFPLPLIRQVPTVPWSLNEIGFCIFDAQANESDSTNCRLMQCASLHLHLQKEKFLGDTLNK